MEDAGQTIILRSGVNKWLMNFLVKARKKQIGELLLMWPTVSRPLDRPESSSMPQIPIL